MDSNLLRHPRCLMIDMLQELLRRSFVVDAMCIVVYEAGQTSFLDMASWMQWLGTGEDATPM